LGSAEERRRVEVTVTTRRGSKPSTGPDLVELVRAQLLQRLLLLVFGRAVSWKRLGAREAARLRPEQQQQPVREEVDLHGNGLCWYFSALRDIINPLMGGATIRTI